MCKNCYEAWEAYKKVEKPASEAYQKARKECKDKG